MVNSVAVYAVFDDFVIVVFAVSTVAVAAVLLVIFGVDDSVLVFLLLYF